MLKIEVKKREIIPEWYSYGLPMLSLLVSLTVSYIILIPFGVNPILAMKEGLIDPLFSAYGWSNILSKLIPLLLCALGLIIAFKAGVWNIGAEGQILMGAAAATWVALFLMPHGDRLIVIPLMYLFGFLFGALWAFLPGFLKAKYEINEILTTIMMNYIAYGIISYLIVGPWRGKNVYGYETTDFFPQNAWLPVLSRRFPVSYISLIIAICLAIFVYYLLFHTKIGFEIRAIGSNPAAAKTSGISYTRTVIIAMILSGGLAGIAGVNEVAAVHHQMRFPPQQISAGYGFTAIIVALLSRLNPIACIPAALLVGIIIVNGYALQVFFGLRKLAVNVFTGLLLISLACFEILYRYKIEIKVTAKYSQFWKYLKKIKLLFRRR